MGREVLADGHQADAAPGPFNSFMIYDLRLMISRQIEREFAVDPIINHKS
jgi:hypothetical protein